MSPTGAGYVSVYPNGTAAGTAAITFATGQEETCWLRVNVRLDPGSFSADVRRCGHFRSRGRTFAFGLVSLDWRQLWLE